MPLKNPPLPWTPWFAALTLAASLAGCGGSDSGPPDPLQPYRQQSLQWAPCDPTILNSTEEQSRKVWQQLGERLQCSTMRAPMDWARPERSDVFVGAMRLAAADPAQRQGSLLFNPGGPGFDGLGEALLLFLAFGQSNPDSAQGALQLRLLASYDMVGFSPRGTGTSTRLHCGTNGLQRFVDPSPLAITDENLANAAYNHRTTSQACQRNPLTAHVNTDATARDLELLRGLLGDDKLNYVGYSYGTWLGSWYASLFPDKVGRMVFDSSFDFTSPFAAFLSSMALARQQLHNQVLLPYAARHPAHFQLGDSTAALQARLGALGPQMQGVLNHTLGEFTYHREQADEHLEWLLAALALDTTLKAVPNPADESAVQAVLQQQRFVPGDGLRDDQLRDRAQQLYQQYRGLYVHFEPARFDLQNTGATYWAVSCNDNQSPTDPQAWSATVRSRARQAPLFFTSVLDDLCAHWDGPRMVQPAVAAMQGLDLLMVQSEYDAATATEGANRFFAQLPKAYRIDVPGDFQHGVFPYGDTCVDTAVVRYLLGESPSARETSCPAKLLEQDGAAAAAAAAEAANAPAPVLAPPKAASSGATAATAATAEDAAKAKATAERLNHPPLPTGAPPEPPEPPTYLDPEGAQKLIDRFKQGIRPRP